MSDIPILHEDNHLLAVVKPPGIPSQADESGDPDMLSLLKQDLKQRYNKPGDVYLGLVHRLDRPVGGAMIFAKTSKAASRLSEAVRSRNFGKRYICVVQGTPQQTTQTLTHYLRKDQKKNFVSVFNKPVAHAKEAILTYSVIAQHEQRSLVAIQLHTGRSHQIRAQLAHIGCPLVGDQKYGVQKRSGLSQIALWSMMISIPHPVSQEQLHLHSLPPRTGVWQVWEHEQLEACKAIFPL